MKRVDVKASVKNLLIETSLAALFFLLGSFLYYFSPLFLEIFLGEEFLNAFAQSFSALKNNAYYSICFNLFFGTALLLLLIKVCENFQRLISFLLNLWILRSVINLCELFLQNLTKKNQPNIQEAKVRGSHHAAIGKSVDDRIFGLNLIESFISDLLRQNLSESYAYAITSKWGNGKTSFLKIIKDELAKTKSEIKLIDFKPWHCLSEREIITEFTRVLGLELESESLKKLLNLYADTLLSKDNWLNNFLKRHESIESQLKNLREALTEADSRYFIFIDDLDRLKAEEIYAVLRLIRDTFELPNLCYIVAFDKDYVIEELKKEISSSERYLEKIFHSEFNLPNRDRKSFSQEFLNWLKDSLSEDKRRDIDEKVIKDFLEQYISNYRSLYSLQNSVRERIILMSECYNITDLVLVCLLQKYHRKIYDLLKEKNFSNLGIKQSSYSRDLYSSDYDEPYDFQLDYDLAVYRLAEKSSSSYLADDTALNLLKEMFSFSRPRLYRMYLREYFPRYFLDSNSSFRSLDDLVNLIKSYSGDDSLSTKDLETELSEIGFSSEDDYGYILKNLTYISGLNDDCWYGFLFDFTRLLYRKEINRGYFNELISIELLKIIYWSIYDYDDHPIHQGFYELLDAPANIEKIKAYFLMQKENPLLLRILFLQAAFADPQSDSYEYEDDGRSCQPKHSIKEYLLTKSDHENQEFLNWVDQNLKYLCTQGINLTLFISIYNYAMRTGSLAEKDSGVTFLKSRIEYLLINDLDSVLALIDSGFNPSYGITFMQQIINHHLEASSISDEVKEKLTLFKSSYLDLKSSS
jgi:hypothetical protein